jgi:hypothetical protein
VVALLAGCGFQHGNPGTSHDGADGARGDADVISDTAPPAPWLSGYGYRKPVRIMPGGVALSSPTFRSGSGSRAMPV